MKSEAKQERQETRHWGLWGNRHRRFKYERMKYREICIFIQGLEKEKHWEVSKTKKGIEKTPKSDMRDGENKSMANV